jgi:hypothetical protein
MLYELKAARLEPLQPVRAVRRPRLFAHLGSSTALVLGFFGLIGELGSMSKGAAPSGMVVGAPIMIVGALAYRSAKKRALGEVPSTLGRWLFEGAAILAIVLLLALQPRLSALMASDPAPYFVIPFWAIVAWLVAAARSVARHRE